MRIKKFEKLKIIGVLEIYERNVGEKEWKLIRKVKNLVTNEGFNFVGNRILGISENAMDTTNGYFYWSNGTGDPVVADTMATFTADGTGGSKLIDAIEYQTSLKRWKIDAFLASTEGNSPGSITKFAITNAAAGAGKLISELKFSAITKNSSKELYFTHYWTFS